MNIVIKYIKNKDENYLKYLEKQRMITIKKPGGIKEQYRLTMKI